MPMPFKHDKATLYMRTTGASLARWRAAAERAGLRFAAWVTDVLNAASEVVK